MAEVLHVFVEARDRVWILRCKACVTNIFVGREKFLFREAYATFLVPPLKEVRQFILIALDPARHIVLDEAHLLVLRHRLKLSAHILIASFHGVNQALVTLAWCIIWKVLATLRTIDQHGLLFRRFLVERTMHIIGNPRDLLIMEPLCFT